jgi:two-component system chemotaxis sensor kinase CheA
MHIIRNCVDHGIESAEERVEQGKPETGTIEIDAGYEGDMVVISVSDDGVGIDSEYVSEKALEKGIVSRTELEEMDVDERKQLIFEPGFSTRTETTETSGRGVGMDVVKSNVLDLNGSIDVDSELGQGTTFELRLPLTLAIVEVLLVEVGQRQYSLPLTSVQEVIQVDSDQINPIGHRRVFELRGETLSLLHLDEILGWADRVDLDPENSQVVIAQSGEERIGIMVDDLLEKREIVIKDLGSILDNVPYVSGATIMGNGDVVLILDAASVVQNVDDLENYAVQPADAKSSTESETSSARILLVEDIRSQRLKLKNILESSGHRVDEASSGEEALSQARQQEYDLVSTDVRMPVINGYELTRKLRSMDSYRDVPIVMVSTLDEEIDKERGFTAGTDEYVEKPFNEEQLTAVVRSLLDDFSG